MTDNSFSTLACSFDSANAYIYIWLSKKWKVIYVGQTNNCKGTIGRAIEHIGVDGTLRKRFKEKIGLNLEVSKDLYLLSFPLPQEKRYISLESSYRLAVEYNVQIGLRECRSSLNPVYDVISKVTYTDVASKHNVKELAEDIIQKFIKVYNNL